MSSTIQQAHEGCEPCACSWCDVQPKAARSFLMLRAAVTRGSPAKHLCQASLAKAFSTAFTREEGIFLKTCSSCLPKSAGTGGPVHIVSSLGALESVAPCVLTVLFVAVVFRAFRRGRPFLRYRHSHLVCAGEIRCWCIAPPCVPTVGRWVGRLDGATRAESCPA